MVRDILAVMEASKYRGTQTLTFDGTTDWMVVYNLYGTDTFIINRYTVSSINIWVKLTRDSGVTKQVIMSRWYPTTGGGLEVNEGGWRIYVQNIAGAGPPNINRALVFHLCGYYLNGIWIYSQESFPLNEWVMVTLTYSGNADVSGLKMYWNGVEKATYTIFNNWFSSANNSNQYSHLFWGVQYTAWPLGQGAGSTWPPVLTFWFEGLLDETSLYRYELNASEVLRLYHGGKPYDPFYVGLPNSKYIQTHFRLGEGRDGTPFFAFAQICYGYYPTPPRGYFRNAFWNNPLANRISLDVSS